ncbi:MAG: DMT family transporter [Burkholderiaceae bacterium]|nr:DMT family transporter [Burkholderiaceae bacterium]
MPAVFVMIWSTGFIVARYAMPNSPTFTFLAIRYGLSAVCFGVWIAASRAAWPVGRTQWLHLGVTGVLMHAAYLGGVWAAVKAGIGAGTVALLVGLQPVLTALWLSAVATPDRGHAVTSRQWAGLGLGLFGLTLVVWRKLGAGEITAWNLSLAFVALIGITAGTLYQKRFVAPCDVRTANTVQLLAALIVSLPLALWESEPIHWTPTFLIAMTWSVVVLTLGGSSLLYLLIQRGAATRVTSLLYLVPPVTALLAWLLFDEVLTASMLLGMALTAIGVALVVTTPTRRSLLSDV